MQIAGKAGVFIAVARLGVCAKELLPHIKELVLTGFCAINFIRNKKKMLLLIIFLVFSYSLVMGVIRIYVYLLVTTIK